MGHHQAAHKCSQRGAKWHQNQVPEAFILENRTRTMDLNPFLHTHTHRPLNNVVEETVLYTCAWPVTLIFYDVVCLPCCPDTWSEPHSREQLMKNQHVFHLNYTMHPAQPLSQGFLYASLFFRTLTLFLMSTHLTACSGFYFLWHKETNSLTHKQAVLRFGC